MLQFLQICKVTFDIRKDHKLQMNTIKKKIFSFLTLTSLVAFLIFTPACSLLGIEMVDEGEVDGLSSKNDKLEEEKAALEKEIDELKGALDDEYLKNYKLEQEKTKDEKIIKELTEEVGRLEEEIESFDYDNELASLEEEIKGLKTILENFESLLSNVYIGTTEPDNNYSFTAFSMYYDRNYYIVTAGHCVNDNLGKDRVFKFKANFSDEWVYPELLGYNSAFWDLDDYAVFYSDRIKTGLRVGEEPSVRNYLLGSLEKGLSVFRHVGDTSIRGESGSPVINLDGEVVGIYVIYGTEYTPIGLATDLIEIGQDIE